MALIKIIQRKGLELILTQDQDDEISEPVVEH